LDSFSVANKRASTMFPAASGKTSNAYDNNGIDMYGDWSVGNVSAAISILVVHTFFHVGHDFFKYNKFV